MKRLPFILSLPVIMLACVLAAAQSVASDLKYGLPLGVVVGTIAAAPLGAINYGLQLGIRALCRRFRQPKALRDAALMNLPAIILLCFVLTRMLQPVETEALNQYFINHVAQPIPQSVIIQGASYYNGLGGEAELRLAFTISPEEFQTLLGRARFELLDAKLDVELIENYWHSMKKGRTARFRIDGPALWFRNEHATGGRSIHTDVYVGQSRTNVIWISRR